MEITLSQRIEQTRSACEQALSDSPLSAAESLLNSRGITEQARFDILLGVAKTHKATPELLALRDLALSQGGLAEATPVLQRALLLRAALRSLHRIPRLPVESSVKHLFCKEYMFFANTPEKAFAKFDYTCHPFRTMVSLALLMRFPAGQQQWEISGFPRRWLLRLSPSQMSRTLYFLSRKAKGFYPYFMPHMAIASVTVPFLSEREYLKSFYRMAASLEDQPAIRGIMAFSWLHSAETHRISPHLAFLNQPYLESGGLYADLGPAPDDSGFLAGDKNRSDLYQSGQYRPTLALVACTRAQALAWKREHAPPEREVRVT